MRAAFLGIHTSRRLFSRGDMMRLARDQLEMPLRAAISSTGRLPRACRQELPLDAPMCRSGQWHGTAYDIYWRADADILAPHE